MLMLYSGPVLGSVVLLDTPHLGQLVVHVTICQHMQLQLPGRRTLGQPLRICGFGSSLASYRQGR